jgi:hypothetical protein
MTRKLPNIPTFVLPRPSNTPKLLLLVWQYTSWHMQADILYTDSFKNFFFLKSEWWNKSLCTTFNYAYIHDLMIINIQKIEFTLKRHLLLPNAENQNMYFVFLCKSFMCRVITVTESGPRSRNKNSLRNRFQFRLALHCIALPSFPTPVSPTPHLPYFRCLAQQGKKKK